MYSSCQHILELNDHFSFVMPVIWSTAEWQEGLFARFIFLLEFVFLFLFLFKSNHLKESDRRTCPQDVQGLPQVESCQRDARHPGQLKFLDHIPSAHLSNMVFVYWYQEVSEEKLFFFSALLTWAKCRPPSACLSPMQAEWNSLLDQCCISAKNLGWPLIIW